MTQATWKVGMLQRRWCLRTEESLYDHESYFHERPIIKRRYYDHIERGLNEIVYVPISSLTYPLLLQQVYKYIHLPDALLKIYVPRSLDTLEEHWTQEWRRRD